jgi:beta-lactam-binding protein with PASTA domain
MPADQAIATIRAAGLVPDLVVEVQPDPVPPDSQGRIWKQNPASGIARDEGTTVRIWGNP